MMDIQPFCYTMHWLAMSVLALSIFRIMTWTNSDPIQNECMKTTGICFHKAVFMQLLITKVLLSLSLSYHCYYLQHLSLTVFPSYTCYQSNNSYFCCAYTQQLFPKMIAIDIHTVIHDIHSYVLHTNLHANTKLWLVATRVECSSCEYY